MQNLSSILGKARRVLYQVKFTDSYKYGKNLVHVQVVPRFFFHWGMVCAFERTVHGPGGVSFFVLVQRLIKNTERNFLN